MKKVSPYTGEDSIRKLLERYACPYPYHVVRVTLMGEIAGMLPASPMEIIRALWNDTLPEFETESEAGIFFDTLLGFWNHLVKHQSRHRPFSLTKSGGLIVRLEELLSFYRALSQGEEEACFPPEVADDIVKHIIDLEDMIEYLETVIHTPEKQEEPFESPAKFDKKANKTVAKLVWLMSKARKIETQRAVS